MDEKIRVFKKLQNCLVNFKKYCETALGSYGDRGEFHPNLDVLPDHIDKASLRHLTALHEIVQEDFIFLSKESRRIVSELTSNCSMLCSMELAIADNEDDPSIMDSVPQMYKSAMKNIDKCLQNLYKELEFPTAEK